MEKQAALLLALCAMFLWGSWANTLLLFGTRFELYLFNYILGHFLAGFLTFHDALPSLNDTVSAGGFAMILLSALAGALFALGSLLAVASLDLAGMALPTLILLSIEMAIGMPMLLLLEGWGTSMQLAYSFLGICLVLLAAFLDAWCHGSLQRDRNSNGSEGGPGHCFGLSSQFSSLSFWSFRATSTLVPNATASSLARSLEAPQDAARLTFLTHGSGALPSSMSSQQVLTGRSGPLPARRVKKANLGLIFAACGGFCFSTWPCLGSLVEGQTAWTTWDSGPKLNASAFFFVYALGAVIAVLLLLPPLCRWPLHTGVNLNFWRSYSELTPWQHFLGLSGGFAHGLGCLLSIQAGRVLGNAIAMSITRCQPLVCATWGVLVWGELHGARWKTKVIFGAMLLMFVLALILFLLAGS